MYRALVCIPAALLVGCSLRSSDTVIVTPASVHAYADECSQESPRLTPQGYVYAGFDFVDQQCIAFFDGIVELQKISRYASSSIATINAQTAAVMGLVSASATSIGIVAAGSEVTRKLIEGYAAEFAFSPYAIESRRVVFDALKAYRDDANTVTTVRALTQPSGDSYCVAQNVVRNYAKICSIGGIEALTRQAIASAEIKKSDSEGQAQAGGLKPASGARRVLKARTPASVGLGLPNFVAGR